MPRRRPRLLVVNVFFAPLSFGGATVVAERMATRLSDDHGWDVVVATQVQDPAIPEYGFRRYSVGETEVIGIRLPAHSLSERDRYDNQNFKTAFASILDVVKPDVTHVHCVQDIGAGLYDELATRRIPTATTVHDCWWICERQFMIDANQKYCHQKRIDLNVCRHCVPDVNTTRVRNDYLRSQLNKSGLILFPSDFQRELFVANGFDPLRCATNKNGVAMPGPNFERTERPDGQTVRFGFVGGPGPIKGAPQIVKAFNAIQRTDYTLKVVDAAQHIGQSWTSSGGWKIPGTVEFVPPYTAETMDAFFADVDVVLFPSQWKESFGLTVREAMARRIWVIASDAGGLSQDCRDGVNARLIPMTADHRPLQAAIEETFEMNLDTIEPSPHIATHADQAAQLDAHLHRLMSGAGETASTAEPSSKPYKDAMAVA